MGSMAASLAFRWLGGSYVMTFALSTVPAALALLLVVTAFGGGRGKAAEDAHKQAHIEGECSEQCDLAVAVGCISVFL